MLTLKSIIAVFLLWFLALPATAQVELEIGIEDYGVEPGLDTLVIPVNFNNYADTISEFMIWIVLDRPDVIGLLPVLDTTSTLISGWEYIEIFNIDGWKSNLYIRAISGLGGSPEYSGFPPQSGDLPLINIHAETYEFADTFPDQTVNLLINDIGVFTPIFINNFGETLGVKPDTIYDTSFFRCDIWVEDICLNWSVVPFPPYDSIFVDTHQVYIPDPEKLVIDDGSVTVMLSTCGDVNGNGDIDIADITALISYLYLNGDIPPVLRVANVNGSPDGTIDISDITAIIASLYLDHRELNCPFTPPHD